MWASGRGIVILPDAQPFPFFAATDSFRWNKKIYKQFPKQLFKVFQYKKKTDGFTFSIDV